MELSSKLKRALLGHPRPLRVNGGRVELFGIPFTPLDIPGLVEAVFSRLARGERGITLFTPDAWATSRAILEPKLVDLYRQADLVACDGVGVAFAARALGAGLPRAPGADLAWALCARAAEEGRTVYLLGGRPGVAARAAGRLAERLPGLRISGTHHGYFSGAGPVGEIRRLRPDLLLVGMGFPKQERWILTHRDCGPVHVLVVVAHHVAVAAAPRPQQQPGCPPAQHRSRPSVVDPVRAHGALPGPHRRPQGSEPLHGSAPARNSPQTRPPSGRATPLAVTAPGSST